MKHSPERRPRTYKTCPVEGCDWQLVTSWFVGGPDTIHHVPNTEQQITAGVHMQNHYTPEKRIFT